VTRCHDAGTSGTGVKRYNRIDLNVTLHDMETDSPSIRTLHRAIAMLGSPAELALALDCSLEQLQSWLDGVETPTRAFIAALAIVAQGRKTPA
jgi:hypothetical protein